MSVHVTCAECQKMYFVAEDGNKEKTHIMGLCPDCSRKEEENKQRRKRKEKKDG